MGNLGGHRISASGEISLDLLRDSAILRPAIFRLNRYMILESLAPMQSNETFVDIHCHLLPEMDDGASSWDESLAMARLAVADGIQTIVATPHQLGTYAKNDGATIRKRTKQFQQLLHEQNVPLVVLPGAEVRIEPDMVAGLKAGKLVSLADRQKHVMIELPHSLYFSLDGLLEQLRRSGMTAILAHPERNGGLLRNPRLVASLVEQGCLMQVTAASLLGTFGSSCQQMAERLLQQGLVHVIATDAHGPRNRRPLMRQAFEHLGKIVGKETAVSLCCHNPARIAKGQEIETQPTPSPKRGLRRWFGFGRAA